MNPDFERLASQEWLLTNGIGGFASGTVAGCATRRYHSLLTVALDPPTGRRMSLLGGLDETVILDDGTEIPLSTHVYEDGIVYPDGWKYITNYSDTFHAAWQISLPIADPKFESLPGYLPGHHIQKSLQFYRNKNAIRFEWFQFPPNSKLRIAPLVCWKDIHSEMQQWDGFPFRSEPFERAWLFQATPDAPELKFYSQHGVWKRTGWWNERLFHKIEAERGFNASESLYCPFILTIDTSKMVTRSLIVSIEDDLPKKYELKENPSPTADEIMRRKTDRGWQDWQNEKRASQFLVSTPPSLGAGGQKNAEGQTTLGRTTIIAGYPWFTDWGRDTFISLPGLCLTTGREETARQIVRDFAPWVKDGRIPNRFPDNPQKDPPAYNNVDGTLWFVRCIGLCRLESELRPTLDAILDAHLSGSVGDGIFCDDDGLLRCGNDHTNLTWMDAKVDGVPITPRFDRPVEVEALWIHALTVGGRLAEADRATESFLEKFVRPDGLGLWDCLFPDGTPDRAIRPGMVIAAGLLDLPDAVNRAVLETATTHLLTPYGLRTLSPSDPAYAERYEGDGRRRDSIYHQGTVWPWLLGSFLDLYKKVHGADAEVSGFLQDLEKHLNEDYGLGGIAEVFDGDAPHRPNGCPWQAWSLAEYLRHASSLPRRAGA